MKLHHIGHVVRDIDKARTDFLDLFGMTPVGEPVIDPLQKVKVQLLSLGHTQGPFLELISPVSSDSPVSRFLEKGGGLHHLCFEVENLPEEIEVLREKGALILGPPVPGRGHGGRMTSWIYTHDRELIELVERE